MKNEYRLQDLIRDFLDKTKKRELFGEQAILKVWNEEMGEFIVANTQSCTIKNGVLAVRLTSSALKFELLAQKSNIIRKLNNAVGMNVLKDILFY